MKCLTEIAGVTVPHYDEKFIALFTETMTQLEGMLPVETNIKDAFKQGSVSILSDCENIALLLVFYMILFIITGPRANVHPEPGNVLLRFLERARSSDGEAGQPRAPPQVPPLPVADQRG